MSGHVLIILYPVCEYAAIHIKDGGRLENLYSRKTTNNKKTVNFFLKVGAEPCQAKQSLS